MIYIIISLFFLLKDKNHNSISKFLFFMLLASSVAAYFVGRQPAQDFSTQFYSLYIAVALTVLFRGFTSYANIQGFDFSDVSLEKFSKYEKIVCICNLLALVINVYIVTHVFSSLFIGDIDVQSHKNEGEAGDFFASLVPHYILQLSFLFSPLGYISLSLHFVYLIKGDHRKAVLYILLSLSVALSGLIALSRSATVQYFIEYCLIFGFIYPIFGKKLKKRILIILAVFSLVVMGSLAFVSGSRFSTYYSKKSLQPSILDETNNPFLFSTLDYFSEWEENGPLMMKAHTIEYTFGGLYNCSGLASHIVPNLTNKIQDKVERHLGDIGTSFHGLIARLVYDFGFIGSIFFVVIYAFFEKRCQPKNGLLRFKTIFFLPVILPLCTVFFAGNVLSSLALDLAIIYSIVIYHFVKQ